MRCATTKSERLLGASRDAHVVRADGFTLLEVMIVSGLLAGFLLLLVQTLSSGVELYRAGESGQVLADRAGRATLVVERTFAQLAGPSRRAWEDVPPDARMVVTREPLGMRSGAPGTPDASVGEGPIVRATVRVDRARERALWRASIAEDVAVEAAETGAGVDELLEERVRALARSGRAEMLLVPWPTPIAGEALGSYLELRQAILLERDAPIPSSPQLLGNDEWPVERVLAETRTVVGGLLHYDLTLQAPDSNRLRTGRERANAETSDGLVGLQPLQVWDSARGGLFLDKDGEPLEAFSFDLGPWSEDDARDDVFPRWVRVELVVGDGGLDTRLASPLAVRADRLSVTRTDRFPDPDLGPAWVKVGPEWIRYQRLDARGASGLTRGGRGTNEVDHPAGTPVRVGREVVLFVPIGHGRGV